MMMNILKSTIILGTLLTLGSAVQAQTSDSTRIGTFTDVVPQPKKAWEFGVGVNGLHMTRFSVCGFQKNANSGYTIDASKKDLIFGGQIYAARELSSHFYLDFQGELDYAKDRVMGGKDSRWIGMAGLGLQWRLGEYFDSHYIDPFLRVGANYMYKNFTVGYNGMEQFNNENMNWQFSNDYNKEGADHKHLVPISLGAGVNMWLNDRFGIGMQADYLLMPYKNVANVWQGAVRLIWRVGGKSKKPAPQYIERIVERVIEKPTYIEKIVEKHVREEIYDLFENVYFVFDKADITDESQVIIDKIAKIMKKNTDKKFMITGCTDARGSVEYNIGLSERRAKAVVDALIERGIDSSSLKWRGVGKRIAYAPYGQSDQVRKGDRKIMVEIITNYDYWDFLK